MLRINSQAPDFSLPDQDGKLFKLNENLGNSFLVVYFYPKDETPGCTAEACAFRDTFDDFADKGARVIGISADSPDSHRRFAKRHNLSFTLLSDLDNAVRKRYKVPADMFGLIPGRVTFVIDPTGKIIYTFRSQFNARKHVQEALKAIISYS